MEAKKPDLIKPIDKASIHRICSGQVILDLATAVKELVENSVDAGATSIEIRLKDYGAESFEVADNGCGISPENYQALTLKYHTSKISDFVDLQFLSSFGFRGEALSSLCALGNLNVVTRTKSEPIATHLTFDHSGHIIEQKNEARPVGTTVTVSKLFSSLPVRYKEFNKNIRREYSRLLSVLHGYALIMKGVRLVCTHITGKNRSVILKTQGTNSIKDNIITIFGTKTATCLECVDLLIGQDCQIDGYISKPGSGSGRASGDRQFFYINSRPVELPKVAKMLNELYRSFNSQQYPMAVLNFILPTTAYDVNVTPDKRKVFLHTENELLAALKESLEGIYAPEKYTYAVHRVEKTVVEGKSSLVTRELPEFETQKCSLLESSGGSSSEEEVLGDNICNGGESMCAERLLMIGEDDDGLLARKDINNAAVIGANLSLFRCGASLSSGGQDDVPTSPERDIQRNFGIGRKPLAILQKKHIQSTLSGVITGSKREPESGSLLSEEPLLKKWTLSAHDTRKSTKDDHTICSLSSAKKQDESLACEKAAKSLQTTRAYNKYVTCQQRDASMRSAGTTQLCKVQDAHIAKPGPSSTTLLSPAIVEETASEAFVSMSVDCEPDIKEPPTALSTVEFNVDKLRNRFGKGLISYGDVSKRGKTSNKKKPFFAASMEVDGMTKEGPEKEEALTAATLELERAFDKADFKRMKILGQFNLGFILAKLNTDLFIIDQHASDEKYNFERLSKTTIMNRQPLLRPLPLDFSAVEEAIVTTHIDTFRRNGFDFVEDKDGGPGQRFCLTAVPFSKNVTFGANDVQEIVSMLAEEPTYDKTGYTKSGHGSSYEEKAHRQLSCNGYTVRPTRVKAMLASRACRSSIMIGDALSKKEMQKVVCHLADLDSPWNCPHGRPTMRHLVDLGSLKRS